MMTHLVELLDEQQQTHVMQIDATGDEPWDVAYRMAARYPVPVCVERVVKIGTAMSVTCGNARAWRATQRRD